MSARARTAVLSVAAVLVVSRLLGFVREMVIADKFGTSAQYDLYLIALILPALAYGVINFASYYLFVPFITRKLEQQPELSDVLPPGAISGRRSISPIYFRWRSRSVLFSRRH